MGSPRLQRSVTNALNALVMLARDGGARSISDLARRMNLDKSTMYRLLCTLEDKGFVTRDEATNNYKIGLRAFEVGNCYVSDLEIVEVATPLMAALAQKAGQRVNLAVRDEEEGDLVYVKSIDGPGVVRTKNAVGKRGYYHATAVGKAILAQIPWEKAEELLEKQGLVRLTDKTITDIARLRDEIEVGRTCGYALDNEENHEYMRCVAAPVMDHSGEIIGGISISALIYQFPDELVAEYSSIVMETALGISRKLGYLGG